MEGIIFLGTYKIGTTHEAIKTAKRLGYYTILFTNRGWYLRQKSEFPDVDQMVFVPDLRDIENIKQEIQKIKINKLQIKAVISLIDPYVSIATKLSNEFCNTNFSVSAIKIMEDKIATRKALENTAFNIDYHAYSTNEPYYDWLRYKKIKFPAVLKLPDSSGSGGVFWLENHTMLLDVLTEIQPKYPNETLLLEEYVAGHQYLVEVIVTQGKVQPVVIIKQDISFTKRFIITGYNIVPNLPFNFSNRLLKSIEAILQTIGFTQGSCHFELRLKGEQWKLIEINPRMSGSAMNEMVKAAVGIDLIEETLKLYLSQQLSLARKKEENVYTYFLTSHLKGIVKSIAGIDKALQVPGVKDVKLNVKQGNRVRPPLSMGHRLGYVLATGSSIEKAVKSAKRAAKLIKIYLQASNGSTVDINLDKE